MSSVIQHQCLETKATEICLSAFSALFRLLLFRAECTLFFQARLCLRHNVPHLLHAPVRDHQGEADATNCPTPSGPFRLWRGPMNLLEEEADGMATGLPKITRYRRSVVFIQLVNVKALETL